MRLRDIKVGRKYLVKNLRVCRVIAVGHQRDGIKRKDGVFVYSEKKDDVFSVSQNQVLREYDYHIEYKERLKVAREAEEKRHKEIERLDEKRKQIIFDLIEQAGGDPSIIEKAFWLKGEVDKILKLLTSLGIAKGTEFDNIFNPEPIPRPGIEGWIQKQADLPVSKRDPDLRRMWIVANMMDDVCANNPRGVASMEKIQAAFDENGYANHDWSKEASPRYECIMLQQKDMAWESPGLGWQLSSLGHEFISSFAYALDRDPTKGKSRSNS